MNVLIPIATAMMLETYPMTIGGEVVRNERILFAKVEDGELMQSSESVRFFDSALFGYPTQSGL